MLDPSAYRPFLSTAAMAHLRESCLALAEKQFFASAVWGAVCLEALLDDIAQLLELPRPSQDDLNGRVQQLQQWSRSRPQGTIAIPDEIIKRCNDIRNTRNRLVHDTGAAKSTLVQDAEFIQAGLKVLLDWFQGVPRPQAAEALPIAGAIRVPGIRTFLSTITPHNVGQEFFLDEFRNRLVAIGIEPVQFVPTIYDKNDPIGRVREEIASCRGLIALGLERTHAYLVRDKEGTAQEKEVTHRQYTSGWLHLEAGIASALGLDVFALCQRSIHSDGIFDRHWNTYAVAQFDSLDCNSSEVDGFLRHLRTWALKQAAPTPVPSRT